MKAAFIERHGGPEVLQFGEMPDPVAASGEVVVDIVAASVNGADWKVREGKSGQLSKFPYILGRDFSGVVAALGEGVTDLNVGDEVFGVCDMGQEGAYAEKIAIKAAIVAEKTDRLSHVDAAALALAGRVLADPTMEHFATVAVGIFQTGEGRLTYASAGHPPPILQGLQTRQPLAICASPPLRAANIAGVGSIKAGSAETIARIRSATRPTSTPPTAVTTTFSRPSWPSPAPKPNRPRSDRSGSRVSR